jgi:hypothetical protein
MLATTGSTGLETGDGTGTGLAADLAGLGTL